MGSSLAMTLLLFSDAATDFPVLHLPSQDGVLCLLLSPWRGVARCVYVRAISIYGVSGSAL